MSRGLDDFGWIEELYLLRSNSKDNSQNDKVTTGKGRTYYISNRKEQEYNKRPKQEGGDIIAVTQQ